MRWKLCSQCNIAKMLKCYDASMLQLSLYITVGCKLCWPHHNNALSSELCSALHLCRACWLELTWLDSTHHFNWVEHVFVGHLMSKLWTVFIKLGWLQSEYFAGGLLGLGHCELLESGLSWIMAWHWLCRWWHLPVPHSKHFLPVKVTKDLSFKSDSPST